MDATTNSAEPPKIAMDMNVGIHQGRPSELAYMPQVMPRKMNPAMMGKESGSACLKAAVLVHVGCMPLPSTWFVPGCAPDCEQWSQG